MRQALAVAAKAPLPGKVKTRLHALLSVDEATELYRCFLKDTLALMASVPETQLVISYTPEGAEGYFDPLICDGHRLLLQRGESFGDKLYYALEDLLGEGFQSVAIMDADSPTLPCRYLQQAFEELARPGDRVVLGPALDGGYYLIGIKQAHKRLFEDIRWSSEVVLEQTVERAREVGLEVVLLPEWYDVDTEAEFEQLEREILYGSVQLSEAWTQAVKSKSAAAPLHAGSNAANTRRFIVSRWEARLKARETFF